MRVRLQVTGTLDGQSITELPAPTIAGDLATFQLGGNLGVFRLRDLYDRLELEQPADVLVPRLDVRGPNLLAAYNALTPINGGVAVAGASLEDAGSIQRVEGVTLGFPAQAEIAGELPTTFRSLFVPRFGGLGFLCGEDGVVPQLVAGPFTIDFEPIGIVKTEDALLATCCFGERANEQNAVEGDQPPGECEVSSIVPFSGSIGQLVPVTVTLSSPLPAPPPGPVQVGLYSGGSLIATYSGLLSLDLSQVTAQLSGGPPPPGTYDVGILVVGDPGFLICGPGPATFTWNLA